MVQEVRLVVAKMKKTGEQYDMELVKEKENVMYTILKSQTKVSNGNTKCTTKKKEMEKLSQKMNQKISHF